MDLSSTWLKGAIRSKELHVYTVLAKILDYNLCHVS